MKSKYHNIATQLIEDIENGVYTDKLPSERQLAERFETTTVTVRRAQDILIDAGLLRKVQPLGTFVVPRDRVRISASIFIHSHYSEAISEIKESLTNAFPDVDVDFQHSVYDPEKLLDFDLVRVAGVSPFPYSDFAVPYPLEMFEEFKSDHYFKDAFDVHRAGEFHYGIPVFISPVLMAVNHSLLGKTILKSDPYALDVDLLLEMAKVARRSKLKLWDSTTVYYLFRSLVFSAGDESNLLGNVDLSKLRTLVEKFWPLISSDLVEVGGESFVEDRSIVTIACRQGVHEFDPKKVLLAGWPRELSGKINLAGEFLFLNNRCDEPKVAAKVAAHFLSPEVQNIIGKYCVGMPVMKSAAVDSIDSRDFRDDLFFNELKNVYINDNSAHEFNHRLRAFISDIISGVLDFDTFTRHLEYEISMIRKREQTQLHFMRDGLLNEVHAKSG